MAAGEGRAAWGLWRAVFRVLVRSRRDGKAVRAALERFGGGWDARVEVVGGVEGFEDALGGARGLDLFSFALLGREDAARIGGLRLPAFGEAVVTGAARVRNNTVEAIAGYISRARARVRLRAEWAGGRLVLARAGGLELPGIPYSPSGDNFLLYGRGAGLAWRLMGLRGSGALLAYKAGGGGLHYAYSGPRLAGVLRFTGGLRARGAPAAAPRDYGVTLDGFGEANAWVARLLEEHAVEWLRSAAPDPSLVVVPWSGGKDSTAALLVAVEAYGAERVVAVYVDTGVDFPENREYVEEVAGRLGVELIEAEAGVDRGLLAEGLPLPTAEDRWCTGRKLAALRRVFKRLERPGMLVVAGDRDAESEARSRRPPLRRDQEAGVPVAAPLKLWGGGHVQAYLLYKGVPLNPLYEAGFYRLGCYICYSLRAWELTVMDEHGVLARILRERPHHSGLLRRFLAAKASGALGEGDGGGCGVCTI